MSRYMKAKYNQIYKNRVRMLKAQNSKENDTGTVGPEPKTNAQYCREYRQRKRSRITQAAADEPGSSIDVYSLHFQNVDYKSNARNKLKQYLKPNLSSSQRRTSAESSSLKKRRQRSNAKQEKPTNIVETNLAEVHIDPLPLEIYIKEEPHDPLDIQDEIENVTEPNYELVQNYTNEFFLVPLSEINKQLEQGPLPPDSEKMS